ncbi:MAG: hypothetical protein JSS66_01985 [Armatimonadetes bacterium]|nr:hypothetical protein [Armatimonadota bacterium]
MNDVLLAAFMIGYVLAAAMFYFVTAKSALKVQEDTYSTVPVLLTVAEGGRTDTADVRRAA